MVWFFRLMFACCGLMWLASVPAVAQESASADPSVRQQQSGPDKSTEAEVKSDADRSSADSKGEAGSADESETVVRDDVVKIDGTAVSYRAKAGYLRLKSDKGEERAKVFYTAYHRRGDVKSASRPITFCFNGGPGSASVWLHMGMLGPKRVVLPDPTEPSAPPFESRANAYSLLDVTDLVFVDPVGTGYSKPADPKKGKEFYGLSQDLQSVSEFIQLYVTKFNRWGSPKFLLGESYGTTRVAGVSKRLQDRYRMEVNGLVLVSSVLDFRTIVFGDTNDLPFVLFLPSYTATAWYHGKLAEGLQGDLRHALREARRFALNDYATALLKGAELSEAKRDSIAIQYARLTGLSKEYVLENNLRVSTSRFAKELLDGRDETVGRFDSRYTGIARDPADDRYAFDASASALFGPFTASVYDYFRNELGLRRDQPYEVLASLDWDWGRENGFVETVTSLSDAMIRNQSLQVFVANGYYDLATPYLATEYTFAHLRPYRLRSRVTMKYYEAGHMMYIHEPSLQKLRGDLLDFYRSTLEGGSGGGEPGSSATR